MSYFAEHYLKLELTELKSAEIQEPVVISDQQGTSNKSDDNSRWIGSKIQEYLKDLCKWGLLINSAVVIAVAERILMNKNANLL